MNRFVSITTYAKLCGISRESVYKRIRRGTAVLLEDCEVPVIDTRRSKGMMQRNTLPIQEPSNEPDWLYD